MPKKKKTEQPAETSAVKNEAPPPSTVANQGQFKCIMIGITLILIMNLALTITAVVLGLQVKTEIETVQENLEPIMSAMDGLTTGGPPLPTP